MKWRDFRPQDLLDCVDVHPAHVGDEIVGRPRALAAWGQLVSSIGFHSAIIEDDEASAGRKILGFGASVFVSRAFVDCEIADPRPGLNSRIIASVAGSQSVVLSDAEIRAGNTKDGLDVAILYGTWRPDIVKLDLVNSISSLLAAAFLENYAGYRLNRFITETVTEAERRLYEATHAWRFLDRRESRPEGRSVASHRDLAIITREDAQNVAASVISIVFCHRTPVLKLRDGDQRFLRAALKGATDVELADKLGTSVFAVKKRWVSLFQNTFAVRPDLFPDFTNDEVGETRGRQKRHHLLAYVREHLEELRPVEKTKNS